MPRLEKEKPASWARSQGFVSAGLAPAPGGGDGGGEAAAAGSWDTRAEHPSTAGGNGLGKRGLEHMAGTPASTWQPPAGPPGSRSRGGSRWGVFASDRKTQRPAWSEGPGRQVFTVLSPMNRCSFQSVSRPTHGDTSIGVPSQVSINTAKYDEALFQISA